MPVQMCLGCECVSLGSLVLEPGLALRRVGY